MQSENIPRGSQSVVYLVRGASITIFILKISNRGLGINQFMRRRKIKPNLPRDLSFLDVWAGSIMTAICALTLGSAPLLYGKGLSPNGMFVAILLTAASGRYYWRYHVKKAPHNSLAAELDGPLLLSVIAWTIFRLGGSLLPGLILFPAITLAWITTHYYNRVALLCILAGLAVETGLTISGNQPFFLTAINILFCAMVIAALYFFPGSKMYRTKLRRDRTNRDRLLASREQAAEMGLDHEITATAEKPDGPGDENSLDSFHQNTVESVNKSFELQLEMVRVALDLTTIAVLWPDQTNDKLRLRYLATNRQDIDSGPYPIGAGVTGALSGERQETEMVGVKPSHPTLPYYRNNDGVGAVIALRIPLGPAEHDKTGPVKTGILCADRHSDNPWSDRDRQVLRLTGKKLALEISSCRLLLNMDRERATIQRLCQGLLEFDTNPDLESIFASSIKAIKAQIPTDLLALCLKTDDHLQIVRAEGGGSEKLLNQRYSLAAGLAGQSIKSDTTLPAGGRNPGATPIFSADHPVTGYQSVMIVPLPDVDRSPIGCLVLAAKKPAVFTGNRQEVLEILASQIAITIKLGQAHERLALLATTDNLTGLVNRQGFQQSCVIMLERARRNNHHLSLLLGAIDHFDNIVDSYGHPFGDKVLREAARAIKATLRTVDLAARYSTAEFALILENCNGDGAAVMAERIRAGIGELRLDCDGKTIMVTLSLGISVFPENGADERQLLALAEEALARAENSGKNRAVLWSDPIH